MRKRLVMPDGMSRVQRDRPPTEPLPRSLLILLLLLVLLGVAGTASSVQTARATGYATREDVESNKALVVQLTRIEQATAADVDDLCRLIYEVVEEVPALRGKVKPCRSQPAPVG